MLYIRKSIVTLDIFYYIPKSTLLNEFVWQTDDIVPELPRIHRFLNFWKESIEARIQDIYLSHSFDNKWIKADFLETMQ